MKTRESATAPNAGKYSAALKQLVAQDRLSATDYNIISIHHARKDATAAEIARVIGFRDYRGVNAIYGRLGRLISEKLHWKPKNEEVRLAVLVDFEMRDGQWHWKMRPEFAEAIEKLKLARFDTTLMPGEMPDTPQLTEGRVSRVVVSKFERNPRARAACLEHYGRSCVVCGFNFDAAYGPKVAQGFIQVHHVQMISRIRRKRRVDSIRDLRPVCPNCHAVIHMKCPPWSVDKVKSFLTRRPPR